LLCRLGAEEEFQRVPPGICLGCRHLLHPRFASHLPPPSNPLGLSQGAVAHSYNYYLTRLRQRAPSPSTPLSRFRRLRDRQERCPGGSNDVDDNDAAKATGERRVESSGSGASAAAVRKRICAPSRPHYDYDDDEDNDASDKNFGQSR
jgi:hypothetical protein